MLELGDWNRVGLNQAADYQANSLVFNVAEEIGERLQTIPWLTLHDRRFEGVGVPEIYYTLLSEGFFNEKSTDLYRELDVFAQDELTPSEQALDQMIVDAAYITEEKGALTPVIQEVIDKVNFKK